MMWATMSSGKIGFIVPGIFVAWVRLLPTNHNTLPRYSITAIRTATTCRHSSDALGGVDDAWQSARVDHGGRTAFSSPHPHRRSAGRSRPTARSNDRLARRKLRRDGWAMTPSGTRGVVNDA